MAQFDIFDLGPRGLVVDCQSDLLSHLRSRMIVPLRLESDLPIISAQLNPSLVFQGATYVLATQFVRSVELGQLGKAIGSLSSHDLTIKRALDMLISGY